jgi:hypothetical protein
MARGRHRTWQERVGGAISVGVPVSVALHLGACCAVEEQVGIVATELNIEAHVRKMVTAEFVRDDSVGNKMPMAAKLDKIAATLIRPVWLLLLVNDIDYPVGCYVR